MSKAPQRALDLNTIEDGAYVRLHFQLPDKSVIKLEDGNKVIHAKVMDAVENANCKEFITIDKFAIPEDFNAPVRAYAVKLLNRLIGGECIEYYDECTLAIKEGILAQSDRYSGVFRNELEKYGFKIVDRYVF
jgi:hypothetical protein